MSSKSRRKAIGEKIGSPTKLGHVLCGAFVVLMDDSFVTDWKQIFQVAYLPPVYFGNEQRKFWGGRVLLTDSGAIREEHNSHRVRVVNDVHPLSRTSPTVQEERERQAKEVAERIAREKAEQLAAEKKAAEDKEAWELATKIGLLVTGHFPGNRDDALKEIDRMIALYQTTHVREFTIRFERDTINVNSPFWDGRPPYPRWFDPDHAMVYNVVVRDVGGNLMPDIGTVEVIGRKRWW